MHTIFSQRDARCPGQISSKFLAWPMLALVGSVTLLTLVTAGRVMAHHGTRVSYDWSKSVEITGVLTEFSVRNPHSFMMFDVTDDDGNVVSWGAEMNAPGALSRIGISAETMKPGDEVTLFIHPSFAGTPRGQHILREPLLINGVNSRELTAGNAVARRQPPPGGMGGMGMASGEEEFDARDFSGVWQTGMRVSVTAPEDGALVIAGPAPMTPEGQAKYDAQFPSYGPRAVPPGIGNDPAGDCNPWGLVRTLLDGRPTEFIHTGDKMVQVFETGHTLRNIYTDGRAIPEVGRALWFGYSVGRWEGNTLVVESQNFDDRTWLDRYANPMSADLRVVERWTRVNYDTLELRMTLHDPEIYSEPVELAVMTYALQRGRDIGGSYCAPVDEQNFNEKIRDPAGGRGMIEATEWEGDAGYQEGAQRDAYDEETARRQGARLVP